MNDMEFWLLQRLKSRLNDNDFDNSNARNHSRKNVFPNSPVTSCCQNDVRERRDCEPSGDATGLRSLLKIKLVVSRILAKAVLSAAVLLLFCVTAYSQREHPLELIGGHYKTLAALSPLPNSDRAALDTIEYPWTEYGKNALTNSLLRTVYLSREDEAKLPGLIKYPANSSDQTRAELDYLLLLQDSRTKEQIARAEYIAGIGSFPNIINPTDPDYAENRRQLFYIASAPVGDWFNDENFPDTTNLLLNCIQDIRTTEFRLKRFFKRPRPYHLEPKLQPLTRIQSPSFASGHTLWAYTEAYLFSEIIPEKREQFLKRADEVRWSRELMGIHYPSDNEASRVVAWYLVKYWYRNPQFRADLEKAKLEWKTKKNSFPKK